MWSVYVNVSIIHYKRSSGAMHFYKSVNPTQMPLCSHNKPCIRLSVMSVHQTLERPHTGGNTVSSHKKTLNDVWRGVCSRTASTDAYSFLNSLHFTCEQLGYGTKGLPAHRRQVSTPWGLRPAETNLWAISFPTERNKQMELEFFISRLPVKGEKTTADPYSASAPPAFLRHSCKSNAFLFPLNSQNDSSWSPFTEEELFTVQPYSYGNSKALSTNGTNKRTKAACRYDGHGRCGVDSFETNDETLA